MTGQIVIAVYRPHAGKEQKLLDLVRDHVPRLRRIQLVTDRAPIIMRAANGTVLEVFEWASTEAIERAHQHPAVQAMWVEFEAVCGYEPLSSLEESNELFPNFMPVS
jgi:quinol monooxygenase YgiN